MLNSNDGVMSRRLSVRTAQLEKTPSLSRCATHSESLLGIMPSTQNGSEHS